MTEPEHDLLAALYGWTMKTSIGRQEEYNNLWEEIDKRLKTLDILIDTTDSEEVSQYLWVLRKLRRAKP